MCLPRVVMPPPHSTLATGRCNRHKAGWRENLKLFPGISRLQRRCQLIGSFSPSAIFPSTMQGATSVCSLSRALYQDRLRQGAPSGDHRQPEHLLPCPKERYRQNAWMHRSAQAEPAHPVRALQDGGLAHHPAAHPKERSHYEGRLCDFYMHFLIGQADGRYMRFMC